MSKVISSTEIKFTKTPAGVLRLGDTRVSLDSVVMAFNQGLSPEEIVLDFDSLSLSEVYAAISYYLQNRRKVDNYLARRSEATDSLRQATQTKSISKRLREQLLVK